MAPRSRPPGTRAGTSTAKVLQTLGWIRKQGFRPVPLHPKSKAAVSRDYVSRDYRPPDDDMWHNADHGIGVVTGPAHGGPVDVDLDCDEAVFFAGRFMPATRAIFGRAGKPRSHYVYKVETTEFDKVAYLDPTRTEDATILELRGDNGHQTVFPGSLHQDTGELIEWSELPFPDVPVVAADVLTRAARMVAIATLIARHAWDDGYHNEPCKHLSGLFFYLGWKLDEAESIIQALMDWSSDTDKSRIPTVRATYRRGEAGNKISGAGVLRKQLNNDRVVDKLLEWAGSPTVNMLQEYNDQYAVVNIEGKFRVANTDVPPGEPPTFSQRDDFLALTETDKIEIEGKPVAKARLWLANPRRRAYKRIEFMPGTEDSDDGVLNLWTGWCIPPADNWEGCGAWLELLHDIICGNEDEARWMLHWFANILREPADKSMTAPVIIGEQGAAKSLLLSYFGRILGPAYITVTNEDHIYGRFNKHLATALLLHSEEALFGGEKKHRGIIKSLVTDEFRIFEQKGIDAKRVRNYLRLVLTSNEDHAAPAEAKDRRFTVLQLGERRAPDALVRRVLHERENGGPAALHCWLLQMDYDPAVARVNLKNEALSNLKKAGLTPIQNWWLDTLTRGTVLPDYAAWATLNDDPNEKGREDWPYVVGGPALYHVMVHELKERGIRQIPSDTALAMSLSKFVGVKLVREQRNFINPQIETAPIAFKNLGDRQSAILNMPPLVECRKAFEKHLGQTIEWPGSGEKKREERY